MRTCAEHAPGGPLGLARRRARHRDSQRRLFAIVVLVVACRELGVPARPYLAVRRAARRARRRAGPGAAAVVQGRSWRRRASAAWSAAGSAMVVLFAVTWVFFVYRDDPYVDLRAHLAPAGAGRAMESGHDAICRRSAPASRGSRREPAPICITSKSRRDLDLAPADRGGDRLRWSPPGRTSACSSRGRGSPASSRNRRSKSSRCWSCSATAPPSRRRADRGSPVAHARSPAIARSAAPNPIASISLAARGFETACADAFMAWLCGTPSDARFVLELRDVPSEFAALGRRSSRTRQRTRRRAFQPRDIHDAPVSRSCEDRAQRIADGAAPFARQTSPLARAARTAANRGCSQDPAEAWTAFGSLAAFLHARWSGTPEGSALDAPRTRRFHRRVIPAAACGRAPADDPLSRRHAHRCGVLRDGDAAVVGILPRRLRPGMGRPHSPRPNHAGRRDRSWRQRGRGRVRFSQGRDEPVRWPVQRTHRDGCGRLLRQVRAAVQHARPAQRATRRRRWPSRPAASSHPRRRR